MVTKHTLFFLFLLKSILLWSQNPLYYKIDQSKGLPSNSVYDIFQDNKGFMWFATNQGLCKYDGKRFNTYSNENQTSKSGSCIKQDIYGRIWFSNFDGYLYYVENDTLKALNNPLPLGFVKYGLLKNHLIIVQKNHLLIYELKTLKLQKKIPFNTNKLITTHSTKNAFYLLSNQLITIDQNLHLHFRKIPSEISEKFPASILQNAAEGLLLISKYCNHYYIIKPKKIEKRYIGGDFKFIQNISFTGFNNWICTTQGALYFYKKNIIYKNPFLQSFNISYVYKDCYGNHWFSTLNDGLLLVPNINTNCIALNKKITVLDVLKNEIYAGTNDEKIYKINPITLQSEVFFSGKTNHEIYFLKTDSLTNKIIFTSNSFKIQHLSRRQIIDNILALKEAQMVDPSYYCFSASGVCGLLQLSTAPSPWDIYNVSKNNQSIIPILNGVQGKSTTYNPRNKTIYYATNQGLYGVTQKEIKPIVLKGKKIFFSKIKYLNGNVYGITTNDKMYWIDTANQIHLFDTSVLINNEGLIRFKVLKDKMYLVTPSSLYEYSTETKKSVKILNLIPEFEITDIAKYKNKIILGYHNGIVVINNQQPSSINLPKFIINTISVNNKKYNLNDKLNLKHYENNIKIQFSVLSYIPNSKKNVFYKINNHPWQFTDDDNRTILLNELASGQYKIQFYTQCEDKKSNITSISFNINKPFWLRWYFILLTIIFLSFLIFKIFKWQEYKINQKNAILLEKILLEKNVNQSKLKAVKSQMNPHFFYNALNTLQSYILSNEKKEAISYLSKFSTLTRTILEMTDKEYITLSDEIKTLQLYLEIEKVRFHQDFSFDIHVDTAIDVDNVKIPTMLLQPYIENAIKHGLLHKKGEKYLHIIFSLLQDVLLIQIEDNGIGRVKSNELNKIKQTKHQSFATKAMQSRIDLLNVYNKKNIILEIEDKYSNLQATGTLVLIKIPIENE